MGIFIHFSREKNRISVFLDKLKLSNSTLFDA